MFGAGCIAVAGALIFKLGPAATVENGTSVRILGAALIALAVGAFSAMKDPSRHHIMLRVEIVFTALTVVFLLYRMMFHRHADVLSLLVLAPVVICLLLLLVLVPRSAAEPPAAED